VFDQQRFMTTIAEFAPLLLSTYDVETVLGELTGDITAVLGLRGSGVTLARDGLMEFATAVPDDVAELERTQHLTQSGPCIDAFRSGQVVAVDDLTSEAERWPAYCEVAASLDIASVAGVPLSLADRSVGALNLCADGPREWESADLDAAKVMAAMATGFLINAAKLHQQTELTAQLQGALDSRVVIEQAKGIIASHSQVSVDAAFDRIRRHARDHQASVHDVAAAIVGLGLRV